MTGDCVSSIEGLLTGGGDDWLSLATMWWGTWLRAFQFETAWGVVERARAMSAREVTPREDMRDSNSLKFIRIVKSDGL